MNNSNIIFDQNTQLWTCTQQKKQWKGQDAIIGYRILNALIANGSKLAQINDDTGVQMTYHEIWLETVRAAQNLQKRGYARDVFGFMADDTDHLVSIILASFCLACPIAPLHPMLSKKEIINVLTKVKPSVMFCNASVYKQLSEAIDELTFTVKVFTIGETIEGVEPIENLLTETGEEKSFVPVSHDGKHDIGAIFCSSGTTGPSKIACIPYDADVFVPSSLEAGSIFLTFESIYWTTGLNPLIRIMQNSNGVVRIITAKPFTPEFKLQLIEKYKINTLANSTSKLISSLKAECIKNMKFTTVKKFYLYGVKVPGNLVTEASQHFPNAVFFTVYGMTEVGGISATYIDANSDTKCGRLVPGTIVKIIDDKGMRCGPNVAGEICVIRENQFSGYFHDSEANSIAVDSEGFFRTGDNGYFDDDGNLIFGERLKNIMRIYYFRAVLIPSEIEDFLLQMPDIIEVCVIAIPVTVSAGLPAAVIVKKSDSKLNQHDVFNAVAENFPLHSWLRGGVYFMDSLPKTYTGKIIPKKVTELATKMFHLIKDFDPNIQKNVLDIPENQRKIIFNNQE